MSERKSYPAPRSAECLNSQSIWGTDEIRDMAIFLRRTKGLVLLDPSLEDDPWFREAIEQAADHQLGRDSRKPMVHL